jgi:ribonuclease HI
MPNSGAKRLRYLLSGITGGMKTQCSLRMLWSGLLMDPGYPQGPASVIFSVRPNRSLSFALGNFATVFQTEVCAILQCAYENIRRAYRNKRILIFSDSQATLKALGGPKVTSELVAECVNALSALAGLNEVTLVWVPGHSGILGNQAADKLVR